jgi:hypothetical protein
MLVTGSHASQHGHASQHAHLFTLSDSEFPGLARLGLDLPAEPACGWHRMSLHILYRDMKAAQRHISRP